MQHHAADQLDVEMAHAQRLPASRTTARPPADLVEDRALVVEAAGIAQALLEAGRLAAGRRRRGEQSPADIGNNRLVALHLRALGSPSRSLSMAMATT